MHLVDIIAATEVCKLEILLEVAKTDILVQLRIIITERMGTITIAFVEHTWAIRRTIVVGSLAGEMLASGGPFRALQPSKASFKAPFRASFMGPRPSLDNP